MQIFAETKRLILREILPMDVDGLFELDSDPAVHRYLGNKPVKDKKEIEEVIQFIRQQYIDNGIGRWAMIEKETNLFVGWTGLKLVREVINNHTSYYDLGYRLIRKHWGKGLATESAAASLDYGFNSLDINEIFAAAHIDNTGSNIILQKLGFELNGTFNYDEAVHNWYRIDKDGRQYKNQT